MGFKVIPFNTIVDDNKTGLWGLGIVMLNLTFYKMRIADNSSRRVLFKGQVLGK